jgi:hypothetical protein
MNYYAPSTTAGCRDRPSTKYGHTMMQGMMGSNGMMGGMMNEM